jgi:14-3-3 protein epsilon
MELVRLLDSIGLIDEAVEKLKRVSPPLDWQLGAPVFKKAIKNRRASWRKIVEEEEKQKSIGNERFTFICNLEKNVIETEILGLIADALRLSDYTSSDDDGDARMKILTLKFRADLFRYLVEIYKVRGPGSSDLCMEAIQKAHDCYQEASMIVSAHVMEVTDPMVLGLVLNHSVFVYEILHEQKEACIMARQALDNIVASLGPLAAQGQAKAMNGSPVDPSLVTLIHLIRDNLVLWTSKQHNTC